MRVEAVTEKLPFAWIVPVAMIVAPERISTVEPDSEAVLVPVIVGVLSDVKLSSVGVEIVAAEGEEVSTVNVRRDERDPTFAAWSVILALMP